MRRKFRDPVLVAVWCLVVAILIMGVAVALATIL